VPWEVALTDGGGNGTDAALACGLPAMPQGTKALGGRSAEAAWGSYRHWQQQRHTLRAVGRLLGDLPVSLQRRMPRMAWGSLAPQRLPYALSHLWRESQAAWDDQRSSCSALSQTRPPSLGNGQAQSGSLQEAVTILEERVQSEAGVEQLMGFLTASRSRQTPEELWQMLHEIRVSQPATAHQKNERFPGATPPAGFPQALTIRKRMR
jgi:hypothetical protein